MNIKLFKELKKAADPQNEFHVYKESYNTLKLCQELGELEDRGLIKLEVNTFVVEEYGVVVEAKGKITQLFTVV